MGKRRDEYGGSVYDQQYFTDDELRRAAEVRAAAEAGTTSWKDAHDYVEGIRSGYNYSGGEDGSGYVQLRSAPSYTSPYQTQIDELYNQIANRPAFSYDYKNDPAYQQYEESYTRNGRRAAADTLAQISARTGGLASSYAGTASQQAYGNYMAALADKIPELRQAAYQMYQDEGDRLLGNLNALRGMEGDRYGRYLDALGQYNANRAYDQALEDAAYNRQWQEDERNYSRGRDALADQRYADETEYNRQLALAQLGQGVGDYNGLNALGITPNWNNVAAATTAGSASLLKGSGGGSGGSGSGGTIKAKDDPMGYLEQFGADSYEDAVAALRLQGVNKDSAEYYARKYMGDENSAGGEGNKNPGIPQRYLDEINDDAEGGMSVENLVAKLERWVKEKKVTASQADWIAASFGY